MDQAKWALPRHRLACSTKEAAPLQRPRVKLHCIWAHNVGLHLFLAPPGIASDSSFVMECLSLALEDAADVFQRQQKRMPRSCLCWATRDALWVCVD